MGAAGLGLGAGSAQADQIWVPDIPWIPWGAGHWVDQWVPGPDLGPPGLVKNTWCPGDPPGHWKGGPHGWPC